MTDSLDYQTPLPQGRHLRWHDLPDGVRVSRDTVSRAALWREAIMPSITFVSMPIAACYGGYRACYFYGQGSRGLAAVYLVVSLVAIAHLIRVIRDAWQNAGIVSEIAVTNGALYWRKQTLWGSNEHFWPLASVRTVKFDAFNRMLKIHRNSGKPLGAFSFMPVDELQAAAARLNLAIKAHRATVAVIGDAQLGAPANHGEANGVITDRYQQ